MVKSRRIGSGPPRADSPSTALARPMFQNSQTASVLETQRLRISLQPELPDTSYDVDLVFQENGIETGCSWNIIMKGRAMKRKVRALPGTMKAESDERGHD